MMKHCFILITVFMLLFPTAVVSASHSVDPSLLSSTSAMTDSYNSTELSLQEWFEVNGFTINATTDELGIETFNQGCYSISILAELADFAAHNNLSWYSPSTDMMHLIFDGGDSTGTTVTFHASEPFGLCLGTPNGEYGNVSDTQLFYTEASRNPDDVDHALVFANPDQDGGYLIAWEDLWNGGDEDYQDMILAMLTPISEVRVNITPRTLNLASQGKWITGLIMLPDGVSSEDVIESTITLNFSIPAQLKPVTHQIHKKLGLRILIVKFDRVSVIDLIRDAISSTESPCKHRIVLMISGAFINGCLFEGATEIRILQVPTHHARVHGARNLGTGCRQL